jgi:phosphatidylserine/phosphatidylglycerophosphate/cardiolipin synthase-like enzyme
LIGPEHELAYGKGIHDIWIKSLKNTCDKSNQENRELPVVLYAGYWLPPANLLRTFAKMMDGTWNCRNVKVKIITNSFETTDVNIINLYARYMMRAFFEHQQKIQSSLRFGSSRGAKFEFFETQAQKSRPTSLHAKVSVFGDDIFIGSANMDVRSYFMDSNNGLLLTQVKDLSQSYQAWINRNLSDVSKMKNMTEFYVSEEMSLKKIKEEDALRIEALFQKYPLFSKLSERNKKELLDLHFRIGQEIYDTTKMILSTDYIEVPFSESPSQDIHRRAQIQQEKIKYLNRFLQLL